MNEVFDIGS